MHATGSGAAMADMNDERHTGTVKFWNEEKGYGFIVPKEDINEGQDVFVHISNIGSDGLEKDRDVEFALSTNERTGKTQARNVRYI